MRENGRDDKDGEVEGRYCLNFENLTRHVAGHRLRKRAGGHRVRFPAAFA